MSKSKCVHCGGTRRLSSDTEATLCTTCEEMYIMQLQKLSISTEEPNNLSNNITESNPNRFVHSPIEIPKHAFFSTNNPLPSVSPPPMTFPITGLNHSNVTNSVASSSAAAPDANSATMLPQKDQKENEEYVMEQETDNTMIDDVVVEYVDELNFLINKFDLKEQKKSTFMPYIF
jgi:hypothetical protein